MHTPPKMNLLSSNNDIMSNADWIAAALSDSESQAVSNYKATAKKAWGGPYNNDETVHRENL